MFVMGLAALGGAVACGSETEPSGATSAVPSGGDVVAGDAGTGTNEEEDAGGKGDADVVPAADAAAPDPATCAVGLADGCCPAALAYGGSDPDCASLACASFVQDAPIPLTAVLPDVWLGQVAMAWTGKELVLARTGEVQQTQPVYSTTTNVVVQRRAPTGALLGPEDVRPGVASAPGAASTALAIDPSGDLYFAWQERVGQQYRIARLAAGAPAPAWTAPLGFGCNDIGGFLRLFQVGGRVWVGMNQYTCAGSTYTPQLTALEPASGAVVAPRGNVDLRDSAHSDIQSGGGFVLHPGMGSIDLVYGRDYEGDLRVRRVDLATQVAAPPVTMIPAQVWERYAPAAASDGAHLGTVTLDDVNGGAATEVRFRLWDTSTGNVSGAVMSSTLLASFSRNDARVRQPSLLWTGGGWLVAVPYVADTSTSFVRNAYRTRLVSLDPSGAVRETFELDSQPSMLPQLAWAGGRIAITWVRPVAASGSPAADANGSQSFLRYLSCAP